MVAALFEGDIDKAMSYISLSEYDQYYYELSQLDSEGVRARFSEIGDLKLNSMYDYFADCSRIRSEGDQSYAYTVQFVADGEDGWKI